MGIFDNPKYNKYFECQFSSPWMKESTKIFMQIFFVASFLCLFFFLYVVKVEKEQFVKQINLIVDNLMNPLLKSIDQIIPDPNNRKNLSDKLKKIINSWGVQQKVFKKIKDNNEKLIQKTKKAIINFAVVLFAIVVGVITLHFCANLTSSLFENLIIVFFIGMTEFLFLHFVASRYISADPNKVKYTILNTVQRYGMWKIAQKNR